MTILVGPEGYIRMVADSDWPLESLARHHGAQSAYRVNERRGSIRVEAREKTRYCVLESVAHSHVARLLLERNPFPNAAILPAGRSPTKEQR
jgi:hypothetical protein